MATSESIKGELINLGTFESGIDVRKFRCEWKIRNPRLTLYFRVDGSNESQAIEFEVSDANGITSQWRISANTLYTEATDLFELEIARKLVKILPNADGKTVTSVKSTCIVQIDATKIGGSPTGLAAAVGYGHMMVGQLAAGIIRGGRANAAILQGDVILHVELDVMAQMRCPTVERKLEITRDNSKIMFGELMSSLEGDIDTADVTLISGDQISFPAHRLLLCKISSYFDAMFRTDLKEKASGIIECQDVSGKSLRILLHFLYTGELAKEWKDPRILWELTNAAHKYELQELLEFLDGSLVSIVAIQDASTFLVLATKLGLKNAQTGLFNLIKNTTFSSDDYVAAMESLSLRLRVK